MKVSKTVSIDLELLQKVIEKNPNFSQAVTLALENWLYFLNETARGNTIHFNRLFTVNYSPSVIWPLLTFDGIANWVKMVTHIEYLTEAHTGLGARCKLFAKIKDLKASSIAEITEYIENKKLAYRAQGEFSIFSSATLVPRGKVTDIKVIIVIGFDPNIATEEIKNEIIENLENGFKNFQLIASHAN